MKLNIEQIRKIISEISKTENINITNSDTTIIQYFKSERFYTSIKLIKDSNLKARIKLKDLFYVLTVPFKTAGFYDTSTDGIAVMIKGKLYKIDGFSALVGIIRVLYHEIKHKMQYSNNNENKYSYESLIYNIERLAMRDHNFYLNFHDDFLCEIDANLFAYDKTLDYLKGIPEIDEIHIRNIESKRIETKRKFNNYDFHFIFSKVNELYRGDYYDDLKDNPILKVLYNEEREFRPLRYLLEDPEFNKLDERIKMLIISSKPFIKDLNFENLNEIEMNMTNRALNYSLNVELERRKNNNTTLQSLKENFTEWLQKDATISKKLVDLNYFISNLLNSFYKKTKNSYLNAELVGYYDSLPKLIEATKTK